MCKASSFPVKLSAYYKGAVRRVLGSFWSDSLCEGKSPDEIA